MKATRFALFAFVPLSIIVAVTAFAQAPQEPTTPQQAAPPPPRPQRVVPLMMALDTNRDGELSAEEIAVASTSLKTLDKDRDSKISAEELRPIPPPVGVPASDMVARLLEYDKNGDGKLSKDELPERTRGIFDEADTDKDGFLTQAELTTFIEKRDKADQEGKRP